MISENVTVLLVESDDILRAIYKRMIGKQAKNIFAAVNGEEGFLLYKDIVPDIIITDIKLPVINGIDMVKKIRTIDKSVRVIMMSAFVDAKYFIQAIEAGVKGFLTKPIDSEKLEKLLKEQIHEIVLERSVKEEGRKRREAEKAREKSDYILRILSENTALFLRQGISDKNINIALKLLGEATSASRMYIFKQHNYKKQKVISQVYEWVSDGVESQLNNTELQRIPTDSPTMKRWMEILQSGDIIMGNVETDFPEDEKEILQSQNIKSVLEIPIFVEDDLWGFIGIDECEEVREWSEVEINALRLVANNIGAAFYRKRVEHKLLKLNADLENRVKERTKELEIEVSERMRTEILLRDSEEKYRLIFENANDGILLLDNVGKIILLNPKMVEVFGLLPKEVIGKPFYQFINKNYWDDVKSISHNDNMETVTSTIDVTLTNARGDTFWLELKPTPILWDGDLNSLIFVSNITLRKIAQDKLNELNLNLEKRIKQEVRKVEKQQQLLIQKSKLESMGELAAGLAHEINQPLGGLSMGLDNILYKLNENDLTNEYLTTKFGILFKDIERIRSIIDHVRVFSRDQQNIQKERVEVQKIIKNALSLIENQFRSENIKLITHYDNEPLYILTNPYRIEQVLLNLFSNARFAVNKKSTLTQNHDYVKQITIQLSSKTNMLLIIIADNGIGMSEEVSRKIFEPFFTTKDIESGTGLGLSISYGIIKESNGKIFAQSVPGEGTKMIIELPLI